MIAKMKQKDVNDMAGSIHRHASRTDCQEAC